MMTKAGSPLMVISLVAVWAGPLAGGLDGLGSGVGSGDDTGGGVKLESLGEVPAGDGPCDTEVGSGLGDGVGGGCGASGCDGLGASADDLVVDGEGDLEVLGLSLVGDGLYLDDVLTNLGGCSGDCVAAQCESVGEGDLLPGDGSDSAGGAQGDVLGGSLDDLLYASAVIKGQSLVDGDPDPLVSGLSGVGVLGLQNEVVSSGGEVRRDDDGHVVAVDCGVRVQLVDLEGQHGAGLKVAGECRGV